MKGVSSFYVIGEIALVSPKIEVNKDELAKAVMKINPRVKAVYIRKKVTGNLRVNELEHIGGETITKTKFKENGITFVVDISKVYVNPSLSGEHLRVKDEIKEGEIVLDAFTGYGGIALHASVKALFVVAGDLNLAGLYLLKETISLNRRLGLVDIVNYDAHYLPFREKAFDRVYGDNPTTIREFLVELCRVTRKELIIYILDREDNLRDIINAKAINEFSKGLYIFKGIFACQNKGFSNITAS
ncbi:methyltransferase [Candidatus Acidianus copahuensis]|uniref:Methyltransferase n=2 Tax=Sulfolobaceae TaxID=118883 RepID=A0A031LKP8_9CREN|nr:methyltransferase [Candidatus Acidianus copahuensis]NON62309.1 methyltransferase [Acidianus sp. RZ1]